MKTKKVVFIAHPISGDISGNIKKVLGICKTLHTSELIPVAPYLVSLQYLNDDIPEERDLGIAANFEMFHRHVVDEVWLFGDRISIGMKHEIGLARELNIPVFTQTEGTRRDLENLN